MSDSGGAPSTGSQDMVGRGYNALRTFVPPQDLLRETEVARAIFEAEHPGSKWSAGRARAIWFLRARAAIYAIEQLPALKG